jgi:hypothetical protein
MYRVKLKPNSVDFLDDGSRLLGKLCDHPACDLKGEYRAPRNRELDKVDYHYFCLEHVQKYNQAWDFFAGMSESDARDHINRSYYGDRPTWKYDGKNRDDTLRTHAKAYREGFDTQESGDNAEHEHRRRTHTAALKQKTPETEALEIMDLTPPLTHEILKARYKALAKAHHPDLHRNCKIAEEKLKQINMAYTVLSVAYESFQQLDDD